MEGVDFILGNDLAGGTVFPSPIVIYPPIAKEKNDLSSQFPAVFSSCVVTRAQARKFEDVVDMSDTCLQSTDDGIIVKLYLEPTSSTSDIASLQMGRSQLAAAQKSDPLIVSCVAAVTDKKKVPSEKVTYLFENDILMRKWENGDSVRQVVVPTGYRCKY